MMPTQYALSINPPRQLCKSTQPRETALRVIFQIGLAFPTHQPGSRRIQVNVITHDPSIGRVVLLHGYGLVTSRKHMSTLTMPRIEPRRVCALQPLHGGHQIALRRSEQQMVMVSHQHVAVNHRPASLTCLPKREKKYFPIIVTLKNRATFVTSAHHMVNRPLVFQANLSRQSRLLMFSPQYRQSPFCSNARTPFLQSLKVKGVGPEGC